MDRSDSGGTRARLLDQLRQRLETAAALSDRVRNALRTGEAVEIEQATARLETLLLEFRVLDQEYRRLPVDEGGQDDSAFRHSWTELEQASLRIARSSAVGSGLLERLVAVSRGLLASFSPGGGESYQPSGRASEVPFEGLRLREMA